MGARHDARDGSDALGVGQRRVLHQRVDDVALQVADPAGDVAATEALDLRADDGGVTGALVAQRRVALALKHQEMREDLFVL